MAYDGVEIFSNGSGSYTELRKDHMVADLLKSATGKVGIGHSNKIVWDAAQVSP